MIFTECSVSVTRTRETVSFHRNTAPDNFIAWVYQGYLDLSSESESCGERSETAEYRAACGLSALVSLMPK